MSFRFLSGNLVSRSTLARYGGAIVAVLAAWAVRQALDPVLAPQSPYLTFCLAILVAARFGGRGPGIVAAVLSGLAFDWYLVEPRGSIVPGNPHVLGVLVSLWITSGLIAWLVGGLQAAVTTAARAEKALQNQSRLVDLSNNAMGAILDSVPEPIMVTDREGKLLRVNEAFRHSILYQTTVDDYVGHVEAYTDEGRLIPPSDWPINRVRRGERIQGCDLILSIDGVRSRRRFSGSPVLDERGHVTHAVIAFIDITDQKRVAEELRAAVDELRHAEIRLRLVHEVARMGTFEWSVKEDLVRWSPEMEAIYGIDSASHLHTFEEWEALVHPEDLTPTLAAMQAAAARQLAALDTTYRIIRPDGRLVWIHSRGKYEYGSNGEPLHMLGMNMDITEFKLAEKARQESERKYRAVFESAAVGIGRVSFGDARWIDVNDAFCRMLGYTRQELLATPWPSITCPDDIDSDLIPFRRMAAGELESYTVEKRFVHKSGHLVWARLSLSLVRDSAGRPDYEIAIVEDIGEGKHAEAALRESEERFRDVADNIAQFAWTADAGGSIFWYNRRWYEYTGTTLEEVQGWGWRKVHHPEHVERVVRRIRHSFETGQRWEDVFPLRGKDGQYRWFLSRALPIRDAQGRVLRWFGTHTDITAQRETEERLRESEQQYRALFGSMQEGFAVGEVICDTENNPIDFRYVQVNEAMASMLRLPEAGVVGHTYRELFPEADWQYWVEAFGRVALTGQPAALEHFGTGTGLHYQANVYSPARGRFAALLTDISERKRAEEALKESESRYRTLFESMQEPFATGEIILDASGQPIDWRYLDVNSAFERTFDRGRAEIVGRTYRELFPGAAWQYWVPALGNVAISGNAARLSFGREGERHFEAIAYSPRPGRFAAVFADVTERRQAEEALRQAKETNETQLAQLEAIIGSMADGLVIGDLQGNLAAFNPAALKMHGFSGSDEACRHIREYREIFEVLDLQGRPLSMEDWPMARALRGETFADQELRVRRSDTGKEFIGNFSGTLVRDASGRGLLPIMMVRDVTEYKRAAEALQRTQKVESIGLLAGGVAHDFNNLLTVIIGNASSALDQCHSCEYSEAILGAAERAASLTKQLLAYAGKGQFVKQAVSLTSLASESRHLLAASVPKRVSLALNLNPELPPVEEDPSRVEQILMNLVINAGEAIPPKTDGRIEISTGVAEITPEAAALQTRYDVKPGEFVWLEVRDTGVGMDSEIIERIFDPFFSTKFTGRGLGLAAVDGIVRSGKGFIDVLSHPGAGTTFRVFLPACEKKKTLALERVAQTSTCRSCSTILVVDDEEMVRKLACMILRRHGCEVLEASDGKHALQVLANAPCVPSLVILDLAMPVMGGDELLPILAERYPGLKVLVSSGYPEEEARKGFRSPSVAGFLQKPYTAVTLTGKIDEILGGEPRQAPRVLGLSKLR